jgi:hypothetical protein
MKTFGTFCLMPCLCLLLIGSANAQIKGLFEKEEPVFNATILPTAEPGTVRLVFYFTHSKASSIETSFWLRDEGTSMSGNGSLVLLRGLRETYNRQQDTLIVTGLNDQHFYTFGVDYRSPGFMSSKFTTTPLKSGYRYESPAAKPVEKTEEPRPTSTATTMPCQNPDLFVQIQPGGYCGAENRPAVQLQCVNCEQTNWTFDVQVRTSASGWISLRTDGERHTATGTGIRVEPLCALEPGTYYVRVLSQGAGCPNTVTHNVGSFVTIGNQNPPAEFQERSVSTSTPNPAGSVVNPALEKEIPTLPDTCAVQAQAVLQGRILKGTLQLTSGSPCGSFYPFAVVHYVHPGYRDLISKPITLVPGAAMPFEFLLDERDVSRNIQTLQVISYARQQPGAEGIPMSAFWIKATNGNALSATTNQPTATTSARNPNPVEQTPPSYQAQSNAVKNNPPAPDPRSATVHTKPYDESIFTEELETVSVKASDPNCTPIQDLNVVFFNNQQGQGDRPLYITWMNPRCCQEDGCKYTIWAGENPDKLRILVEGSKRGVFIRELLQDLMSTDTYIEVSVKTTNGNRKAAYVLGKGSLYGIEALADYRDRLKPPTSDQLATQSGTERPNMSVEKSGTSSSATPNNNPTATGNSNLTARTPVTYDQPQKPLSNFQPCKYAREILVIGERPARIGTPVTIQYDFSDPNYRYTLYLQPAGTTDWVLAPGVKEAQENPVFQLNIKPYHAGKYAILVHKAAANWGCIAAPLEQAIAIQVSK